MKRISFVLIFVLPVFAMMAFAQEHRFSVGVNFMTPIGQNGVHDRGQYNWIYYDSQSNYNEYWEAGIEGTYTLPVYRCLEFQPSLSLSYARHHNFNLKTDGGSGYYVRGRLNQMNLDLCVPVSVRLKLAKSSVDIGAGPVLGTYLFQKQKNIMQMILQEVRIILQNASDSIGVSMQDIISYKTVCSQNLHMISVFRTMCVMPICAIRWYSVSA